MWLGYEVHIPVNIYVCLKAVWTPTTAMQGASGSALVTQLTLGKLLDGWGASGSAVVTQSTRCFTDALDALYFLYQLFMIAPFSAGRKKGESYFLIIHPDRR